MILTKIDTKDLAYELDRVIEITECTDNMATMEVCQMFMDLCERINDGIQTKEMMYERYDAIDRAERHSIAGHMNDPSPMQEIAFIIKEDE